ncbi:polyhydroxyalkanoate synthesis repressor PhaR [Agarilytica rhodophyticola]|uniref:polyhydroxyalkanoate synthesis repressor PhaR n=1 Tax=Agarilytica rhodophyticola TaxID=1737490 RepID=UPI000B347DD4|nr:polyhydroxyalkanoate synthesis repressor PhaR [Agarilytica rhodophyticola]
MITIKKYPNRRLYDTSKSQYINLEVIRELVMSHEEFCVIDSKTEEDLTKSILLQIISEQENNDQQSLLTQSVLKQLIRFYGSDMQVFLRQYIEQSIATFLDRQEAVQGVVKDMMDASPLNVFNQMMEQNMSMWGSFAPKPANKPANKPKKQEKRHTEDDLDKEE